MEFNSPLGSDKADRLIALLDQPAGSRVLDVGCGTGAFLLRLVAASGAQGFGVDSDPGCVAQAQERASGLSGAGRCDFRASEIGALDLPPATFDTALCIGSSHAFGSGEAAYPNALAELSRLVRPGGMILLGEGYWKQPPDPQYLALIGDPVGIYHSHAGNIAVAEEAGLLPLYATVSNEDEWDHFEWSHRMRFEQAALQSPDDPATRDRLRRSRAWRDGYLKWGRDTMGFGFYLFLRPPGAG